MAVGCICVAVAGFIFASMGDHVNVIHVNSTASNSTNIPTSISDTPTPSGGSYDMLIHGLADKDQGVCKCSWELDLTTRIIGGFAFFGVFASNLRLAFGWTVRLFADPMGRILMHFSSNLPYKLWKKYTHEGFLNLGSDLHKAIKEAKDSNSAHLTLANSNSENPLRSKVGNDIA